MARGTTGKTGTTRAPAKSGGSDPGRRGAAGSRLRVLGIDPGSRVTGFGVVERHGAEVLHVAHGTIRVPDRESDLSRRLAYLCEQIRGVVERHAPDVAAVEQVFVSASPRSALVLGQARGAALVALAQHDIAVAEYAPAEIKQSTAGSGRASKQQIQRVVKRLLGLEKVPAQDAADALATAMCHAQAGALAALPRVPRRRGSSRGLGAVRVRRAP